MKVTRQTSVTDEEEALLLVADPSLASIRDYVARGMCYVWRDVELIGIFVLLPTRPFTVELTNIAIAPTYQGRGYGKQLLNFALQVAKSSGYKQVDVGTGNSSIGQLAFYQKAGFRIVGIERDYFTRHYDEVIVEEGIVCTDMVRLVYEIGR